MADFIEPIEEIDLRQVATPKTIEAEPVFVQEDVSDYKKLKPFAYIALIAFFIIGTIFVYRKFITPPKAPLLKQGNVKVQDLVPPPGTLPIRPK